MRDDFGGQFPAATHRGRVRGHVKALSVRQKDVLAWIGQGCPDHDWPDFTYRTTAKALRAQGLVKVKDQGASWTATVTDTGRAVLAGGVPRADGQQAPYR